MDTEAFAMILLLAGLLAYLLPMVIVALRDVQGGRCWRHRADQPFPWLDADRLAGRVCLGVWR